MRGWGRVRRGDTCIRKGPRDESYISGAFMRNQTIWFSQPGRLPPGPLDPFTATSVKNATGLHSLTRKRRKRDLVFCHSALPTATQLQDACSIDLPDSEEELGQGTHPSFRSVFRSTSRSKTQYHSSFVCQVGAVIGGPRRLSTASRTWSSCAE